VSAQQGLQLHHDRHDGGPRKTLRLRLWTATALALLLALAASGVAHASTQALFKDCGDGSLDGHYSQKDYANALANLPADLDEYSDCRSQIQRARLGSHKSSNNGGGGTGGGGIGTGTGGPTGGGTADTGTPSAATVNPLDTATPAERASFKKAITAGDAPVEVDGRPIDPGALGGAKTNGIADLPAPLLAILALLAIGGLSAAGFGTRRLVHSRRLA
jgi:hypothetical protein